MDKLLEFINVTLVLAMVIIAVFAAIDSIIVDKEDHEKYKAVYDQQLESNVKCDNGHSGVKK